MRASEFVIEPGTMLMGKLAKTGQIVRIIKQVTGPAFAKDKSEVWSLIDTEPERRNKISSTKWVPADTSFEWVRPYLEKIDEISRDRLERYLDRANRQVDTRQERMARARQRLSTSYEIYHAETPNKVVDRFEADTPALAQKYYQDYIEHYESDVDYDLRLRRGTGIDEQLNEANFPSKSGKFIPAAGTNSSFQAGYNFGVSIAKSGTNPDTVDKNTESQKYSDTVSFIKGYKKGYSAVLSYLRNQQASAQSANKVNKFAKIKSITPDQIKQIVQRWTQGETAISIAPDFGLGGSQVTYLIARQPNFDELKQLNQKNRKGKMGPQRSFDFGLDEGYARKLNFDEIYGKYLKVTDNNGDPNKEGFSLVTPLNGDSWNWRERPEFIPLVKKKLNQPGFLRPYKYKQIIDSMAGKEFDPKRHIAQGAK